MRRHGQVSSIRRDSSPRAGPARNARTRRYNGGERHGAIRLGLRALAQDAALLDGIRSDERGRGGVEGRGAELCARGVFVRLAGEGVEGDAVGAEELETADGFQLWGCVSGRSLWVWGTGNSPLATSLSVSMVNSSNAMGWRQSVVLRVTVAAEVVEMSAARAAVTVKVFMVD